MHKKGAVVEKNILDTIIRVNARDMPSDVVDWCCENEYSIHGDNSVAQVPNNNNPFADWLRREGYIFSNTDEGGFDHIAIIAT